MKTIFAVLIAFGSASAQGGEILRLKSGDIRLEDQSQSLLTQAFSLSSNDKEIRASRDFVIQFQGQIAETLKKELSERGIRIMRYLPDDALLVRGELDDVASAGVALESEIQALVPFAAEWRLSDDVLESREDLIHVSTFDIESFQQVREAIRALPGARVVFANDHDFVLSGSPALAQRIAAIDGVEWVQAMPLFIQFDLPMDTVASNPPTLTGYESGTRVMGFDAAWARGWTGAGQTAAMSDTGLDTGDLTNIHSDFEGRILKGYALGVGSSSWEDPQAHGTHVSGSVVGTGAASNGAIRGGAYEASFVVESLWSPLLNNLTVVPDFNQLMGPPHQDGARVHTNSWGNPKNLGTYDSFANKADEFMWKNPDMLVLFAAGNSGEDQNRDGRIDEGSISSPGTAKNVLTVGASENLLAEGGIQKPLNQLRDGKKKWGVEPIASDTLSNHPSGIAAFSSRGPTKDGRIKPEVVAPGTNIVSARSRHKQATQLWGAFDEHYLYAGGTSMATPLTAGAATVARQYLVDERQIANPSAALVKATLMHTATDLYPGQFGTGPKQELTTTRPNAHQGYGRVDVDAATSLDSTTILDSKSGVGKGENEGFALHVEEGKSILITMAYTDAPAAVSASKTLVNDLDIKVIAPNGQIHKLSDRVNNSEMLHLKNLPSGEYQITVEGVNVPNGKNGKQPFSVLATLY